MKRVNFGIWPLLSTMWTSNVAMAMVTAMVTATAKRRRSRYANAFGISSKARAISQSLEDKLKIPMLWKASGFFLSYTSNLQIISIFVIVTWVKVICITII